jgi:hypothetical protein
MKKSIKNKLKKNTKKIILTIVKNITSKRSIEELVTMKSLQMLA